MNENNDDLAGRMDWDKGQGLLPAIVQHARTGQVLMLGYMSEESLDKTLKTGLVTFFSRSRKQLWTKGETSGHTLELVDIVEDCDQDTLLVQALPQGPTCHRGTRTCFGEQAPPLLGFLADLEEIIEQRKSASAESSYTAKLLTEGIQRCAQKVGEEGVEVALAAVANDSEELLGESADLIYHLLIVLAARDLTLDRVIERLQQRHSAESP